MNRINLEAIARACLPLAQGLARIEQDLEVISAGLAMRWSMTHREAHDIIMVGLRSGLSLDEIKRVVSSASECPAFNVEPPEVIDCPTVTEPEPAPTCPPIGARLGRRLGVRRR